MELEWISEISWANWIGVAATVAVAWTAIQSLRRERKRDTERQAAADARISIIAYALRRQLQSWWPDGTWPGEDVRRHAKAGHLTRHQFPDAEDRVEELASLAAEASPGVADAIREAAVRFYRGTRFINETANADFETSSERDAAGQPEREGLPRDVNRRFDQAWSLLRETVDLLEEAISADLLEAEEALPD